jgi:hypothetical protein
MYLTGSNIVDMYEMLYTLFHQCTLELRNTSARFGLDDDMHIASNLRTPGDRLMQLYGYCRAHACTEPGPEHIPIKNTCYLVSYNWVDTPADDHHSWYEYLLTPWAISTTSSPESMYAEPITNLTCVST